MTENQLSDTLKIMYDNAEENDKVCQIHLFGIKYANELDGANKQAIAYQATGKKSYGTEISKGIRLSQYVSIK